MSHYRHYPYFCLLCLSSLNHSTRSTAGSSVTTQHAEVKIGEVSLKKPTENILLHLPKQSCH